MVQTVIKEQYEPQTVTFTEDIHEQGMSFTVYGQTVDRSYEDRNVYFHFHQEGWMNGEDAIALGQLLIKHGTRALMANMVNHQLIHHDSCLRRWIHEQRVQKLTLTVVDESPANHGRGHRTFLIKPTWYEGMAPLYEEDFAFERIMYISPLEDEYKQQIAGLTCGGVTYVEFVGYDHEAEVAKFKAECEEMMAGAQYEPVEVADAPETQGEA